MLALLMLLSLPLAAPGGSAAPEDAVRILRGAERISFLRGTLHVDGCDGIVRMEIPPGAFARVKRLRLAPWTDALEGAEFLAGTESVKLLETGAVRAVFRAGALRLELRPAARKRLARGGMLILVDRYR